MVTVPIIKEQHFYTKRMKTSVTRYSEEVRLGAIDVGFEGSTILVQEVPVPAGFILFLSAMSSLFLFKNKA